MKSLYSFLFRVNSASTVKLSASAATNPIENLFKKFILRTAGVVALLLVFGGSVKGQTTIASESFENTMSLFTPSSTNVAYYSGNSASSDGPATSPLAAQGTYSWGVKHNAGSGSTTATLTTTNDINTSSYSNVSLSFRLASLSLTNASNGADAADIVTVSISPDGGANYYSTVRVLGNSNAYWAYSASGSASTSYDGNTSPVDFQPAGGGSRTTDGYSTVSVTGLPSITNLKVKITLLNDANLRELWVIDDFKITGTSTSVACSGTPSPGNTLASSNPVVSGSSTTLSLQNSTAGSGVTYQWQSSANNSTWTDISGATSATYSATPTAATYYRCNVSCSGNTGASTAIQVGWANLIPATSFATVNCGTNTVIYDHNGTSNYSNGVNGYLVLSNVAGSTAVITLTGTYATEASFDFLKIYSGSGTSGTLIASYSGSGTITTVTGLPGETITVQFTSDGSTVAAGLNLTATYSGSCELPVISKSISTLSGFSTCSGTASISQSFSVSGTNMQAGILVTAPTGFEVSTDNTSFSSSLTVGASGTISSTTVYVRLSNGATGAPSGNIALTSTNATTQNIAVSGTVTAIPACISSFTPADLATGQSALGVTISWTAVQGATGYDVYFNGSLVSTNQSGVTYATGALTASTTYTWKVVPKNSCGAPSSCSTYSFTTAAACNTPTFSVSSTNATCFGGSGSITLTTTSGDAPFTYTKDNGINWLSNSGQFNSLSPGTYTVNVSGNGCLGASQSVTITQPASAVGVSAYGNSGCFGSLSSLSSSASGGTGTLSYSWSPTTGLSSALTANPTLTISATQEYTLTVTDANGCTAQTTATITNNSPSAPTSGGDFTICSGSAASISATSSAGTYINWYDAPTGGNLVGTTASGVALSVSPGSTTTYYAEAVTGTLAGSQVFTSGSGSFTVPSGITTVIAECIGGGGGGAGSNTANAAGGGGGGGAYSRKSFTGLTGGTSILYYNVGAGGNGGSSSSNGASGNDSWTNISNSAPSSSSGALAKGGSYGFYSSSTTTGGNGGIGGVSSSGFGDIKYNGGNGSNGVVGASGAGGGGGAGANVTSDGASSTSETGAIGVSPGGSGGSGGTNTNGSVGLVYGGGGGGGHKTANSRGGSAGAAGYVKLSWENSVGCSSSRTIVIVTVNPIPTISGTANACVGSSSNLVASISGGTWATSDASVADVNTSGVVSGIAAGTANITYSLNGCTSSATVFTVNGIPSVISITPNSATICSGNSQSLVASGGVTTGQYISGALNTVNAPTGYPAPLSNYYGGTKTQMLFTSSELSALGYSNGDKITSLSFAIYTVGTTPSLLNFQIDGKLTSSTTLSATFETGLTSLKSSFTWSLPSSPPVWSTVSFSTPIVWDGTSSVLIQTSYSNSNTGATANAVQTYMTDLGVNKCSYYRADAVTAAAVLGATTATTTTFRPDIKLGWEKSSAYTWSPSATLNTTSGTSVSATPTTTTTYTATATSAAGCSSTGNVTVTVNPLPTASISGTTAVCLNATSPSVTFTGANGTAPYTFTYKINNGSNLTVTTTSGSSVTVSAPTSTAGSFAYYLVSVADVNCSQTQSGSATITVNPLPTASISGTVGVCVNATAPNVTFTGAAGTAPYTFTYNINGGSNQTVTTTSGNSVTVSAPTSTAGVYAYNLVSVQDASSTACSQVQTGTATVTVTTAPNAGTVTGTTAICSNGTTTLSSDGNSGGAWTSATQSVATVNGSTGVITPVAAGTSIITYTVTGTGGCSDATASATVTVTAAPNPGTISGTSTICQGATAQLQTNGNAGGTWASSNSNTATVSSAGLITGLAAGTTSITYTVAGTGPCSSALASITVTVNGTPATPVVSVANVCGQSTLSFTPAANATILWSNNATTASATTVNSETLTVVQTVNGCPSSAGSGSAVPLVIPSAPTATASQNFCVTDNATVGSLAYTSVVGNTYTWYDAATAGNTVAASTQLPTATTTYYLSTTGSNGCTSTSRTAVAATEAAQALASVSITGVAACPGGVNEFTATPVNGGPSPTYQWYNGGVPISGATSQTYSATGLAEGAVITVKMIPSGSCVTVCP